MFLKEHVLFFGGDILKIKDFILGPSYLIWMLKIYSDQKQIHQK